MGRSSRSVSSVLSRVKESVHSGLRRTASRLDFRSSREPQRTLTFPSSRLSRASNSEHVYVPYTLRRLWPTCRRDPIWQCESFKGTSSSSPYPPSGRGLRPGKWCTGSKPDPGSAGACTRWAGCRPRQCRARAPAGNRVQPVSRVDLLRRLAARDLDLPRLGLLGHRDAERKDPGGVRGVDPLSVEAVAEEQLTAARPGRAFGRDQLCTIR